MFGFPSDTGLRSAKQIFELYTQLTEKLSDLFNVIDVVYKTYHYVYHVLIDESCINLRLDSKIMEKYRRDQLFIKKRF